MDREELKVRKRDVLGKKVRFLRRSGVTPANVYGGNTGSVAVQIETPVLERLIAKVGRNALVTLRIDGKRRVVMLRDIDRDALTDELLHVGFFAVEMTHKVKAEVPLAFVGESVAEKSSRVMLIHNLSSLDVEALPADLPRSIEVDVSQLAEPNDAVHVRDIALADGVEVLTDADEVVVQVRESRIAAEVIEEEMAAEEAEVEEVEGLEEAEPKSE
ncbi:MAG: 50S ribosomal protein L25 [Chloroflexota bacterium]